MENKELSKNKETAVAVKVDMSTAAGMKQLYNIANLIAKSDIIPDTYKNKPENCIIALNMANRMGADPMMVMQNLYQVYGRPSFSSKFLIATFNYSGKYTALKYEMSGKEGTPEWGCTAYATEIATGEKVTGSKVTLKMAKDEGWLDKKGSKWQTMPEKMLRYRAASFLINEVAPEISCGMPTEEETRETYELHQDVEGTYSAMKQETAAKMASVTVEAPAVTRESDAAPF